MNEIVVNPHIRPVYSEHADLEGDRFVLPKRLIEGGSLTGNIPDALFDASSLMRLDFDGNDFQGMLPTNIGNLDDLRIFQIDDNMMTGPLPTQIGQIPELGTFLIVTLDAFPFVHLLSFGVSPFNTHQQTDRSILHCKYEQLYQAYSK